MVTKPLWRQRFRAKQRGTTSKILKKHWTCAQKRNRMKPDPRTGPARIAKSRVTCVYGRLAWPDGFGLKPPLHLRQRQQLLQPRPLPSATAYYSCNCRGYCHLPMLLLLLMPYSCYCCCYCVKCYCCCCCCCCCSNIVFAGCRKQFYRTMLEPHDAGAYLGNMAAMP